MSLLRIVANIAFRYSPAIALLAVPLVFSQCLAKDKQTIATEAQQQEVTDAFAKGEYQQAADLLENIIEQSSNKCSPQITDLRNQLAVAYTRLSRESDAIAILETAIEESKNCSK